MKSIKPIKLKCRLTIKTPTSVTTGEDYYDTEYFVKDGKFYLLNQEKFIDRLGKSGKLEEFFKLTANPSYKNILRIRKLLFDICKEEDADKIILVDDDFESTYKSNVFEKERALNKINRLGVKRIFREPVTKEPYIPGSTIKGALRTAILNFLYENSKIKNNFKKFRVQNFKSNHEYKIYKKKLDGMLNKLLECTSSKEYTRIFKTESSKDLMRFVKVSDFNPISYEERIGTSHNFKLDSKKGGRGIPIQVEYLNSGIFEGEISIYPEYAEEIFETCGFILNKENLIKVLKKHYEGVYKRERELFNLRIQEIETYQKKLQSIVKLGFHAGALSKTINDDKVRKVGNKRTGIRSVPKTTWVINSKPMGWCILEVLD
jgi:CRISPR type III-A-associated RAMP protein Csm5